MNRRRGQNFVPDIFIWRLLVWGLGCVFALLSLKVQAPVQAQPQGALVVQPPDNSEFPLLSVELKLSGPMAHSEDDLSISQFVVFEGSQEVTVQSLQKTRRGVHFTLAINGAREFDLRDSEGVSNFAKLRGVLRDWAVSRDFSEGDAWSLETNQGMKAANVINVEDWLNALEAYEPNFRAMTSDINSLDAAIRVAAGRVVPFGVDKTVLYITAPPTAMQIEEINAISEAAREAGIRVSVWMVGDPMFLHNEQGGALISLAEITGGSFFYFSGTEPLPDPGSLLTNLGTTYVLQYESLIRQTGSYPLKITADLADGSYQGESPPFYIEVLPPKAVLVDPPMTIYRTPAGSAELTTAALMDEGLQKALHPDSERITFQVDFPDGYPREIVASRLIVNGVVVAVNDSPPFNEISWDISTIIEPGEQIVQVEISDSLGLTGITNEFPVRVVVDLPEPEPDPSTQEIVLVLAGVLLGIGALLFISWGVARLIQIVNLGQLKGILKRQARKAEADHNKLSAKSRRAFATLVPTGVLMDGWEASAIRITKPDVVFGSDPNRVDYLLLVDSVDAKQARLRLRAGEFWLQDLGSSLGTWVNYARIGSEPEKVYPGDLLHFGNCEFRFTMMDRSLKDSAHFTPYEPLL